MDFLIQQGTEMKSLSREYFRDNHGSGIIMSALQYFDEEGVSSDALSLRESGGSVFFDPQLYAVITGRSLKKSPKFPWWPDGNWADKGNLLHIVSGIVGLNDKIKSDAIILPGKYISRLMPEDCDIMDILAEKTAGVDKPRFMTICLSAEALNSERQMTILLARSESWGVEGVYLIPERPDSDYLSDDPQWLEHVLKLCAGFRLQGKKVVCGYANHQLLPLACAGATAIAAGNYSGTRTFRLDSFWKNEDRDFRKSVPKYYCPHLLTEFSIKYMHIAWEENILSALIPTEQKLLDGVHALFSGDSPHSVKFDQTDASLHYLNALRWQCKSLSVSDDFHGREKVQIEMLESAREGLVAVHKRHVRGQVYDFLPFVDVAQTAIGLLSSELGFQLTHFPDIFA